MRIDKALLEMGHFENRSKALEAIKSENVTYKGLTVKKGGLIVDDIGLIEIKNKNKYVSRAGLKLESAIKSFEIDLSGKIVLDIGSSTGGFVDCALSHHAKKVTAVDVGSNQLSEKLRSDKRVELYEKTDFRYISEEKILDADIITIDVSFISVKHLLTKIRKATSCNQIICLIKPQFEVGKEIASKYRGVIKDIDQHKLAINSVVKGFNKIDFYLVDVIVSPIEGKKGNTEYLAYLKKKSKSSLKNNKLKIF